MPQIVFFCLFACLFFRYVSCLVFSKLSGSVVWCLSLISHHYYFRKFSCYILSFFPFGITVTHIVPFNIVSHSWMICSLLDSFSLRISAWELFIDLSLSSLILFLAVSSLLMSPLKEFFISFTVF